MMQRILFVLVIVTSLFVVAQQTQVNKTTAPQTSPASGKEMYNAYCASCHGTDGKGNGPAASAMKTAPTDLTQLSKNNNGKFPSDRVYESIKGGTGTSAHGSKDMPTWGPVFRRLSSSRDAEVHQRIVNLSKYIESLQGK
jgi:mono/diheme cytochrome c family protein